jgi:hypothetical protein
LLRLWGKAIAKKIVKVRVVELEVEALVYEVRKPRLRNFRSHSKLWFIIIPSFLSMGESTPALRKK